MKKSPQELLALTWQLLSAGRLDEARRACRKTLQARPDLPDGHLLFSEIYRRGGDALKARESASRALKLRPGWSEAYVALGNAEALAGNLKAAEEHFHSAIAAGSPGAGVHANLGHVLRQEGRLEEARAAYEAAACRESNAPALHFYVAEILADLGRNDEALLQYRRALDLDPRASEPREGLLRMLHAGARFADMEAVAREGMALHPDAIVYRHQFAVALWWQERHDESLAVFQALDGMKQDLSDPAYQQAKLDQAMVLLVIGHFRDGWDAYGWRPSRATWHSRFPQIAVDPRELGALKKPSRIELIGEQGLGDELFFLRFAAYLRATGHRLTGRFDRKLLGVLSQVPGLFERLVSIDDPEPVGADVALLTGDLPLATGREMAAPLTLRIEEQRRADFDARMRAFGPPPYIGVTWQAGTLPDERKVAGAFYLAKDVPPDVLGAALRPVSATIVVMQRRPTAEALQRFSEGLGRPALDLNVVNDDLQDALAVVSLLDDYVGVSNTNTHLRAGCPGKVARVLVPSNPEWRWGLRGDRSMWFPDARIYRQSARDGWVCALQALTSDLRPGVAAKQHHVG